MRYNSSTTSKYVVLPPGNGNGNDIGNGKIIGSSIKSDGRRSPKNRLRTNSPVFRLVATMVFTSLFAFVFFSTLTQYISSISSLAITDSAWSTIPIPDANKVAAARAATAGKIASSESTLAVPATAKLTTTTKTATAASVPSQVVPTRTANEKAALAAKATAKTKTRATTALAASVSSPVIATSAARKTPAVAIASTNRDTIVSKDEGATAPTTTTTTSATSATNKLSDKAKSFDEDVDKDCPFRNSPIYRSVYVYPSPGSVEWQKNESGVVTGKRESEGRYPWDDIDETSHRLEIGPYDIHDDEIMMYNTELLVREIIMNPSSCLRTHDPENATLFYVPFLPATEFHVGNLSLGNYAPSPYGLALIDVLDHQYESWETLFGLTSRYWQRRNGSDHILVFSEPLHGLWHPRSRRGNFHFVMDQRQLAPPIVVSVELSTTFVNMYPNCARKNIIVPYPNTDGRWFNFKLDRQAEADALNQTQHLGQEALVAMLAAENDLLKQDDHRLLKSELRFRPRRLTQYYRAGPHGSCKILRKALTMDFACTASGRIADREGLHYSSAFRQATFCPCPGGDSPSAKRMYDALHGGCIPVILSHDFVWPYSTEFDLIEGSSFNSSTGTHHPYLLSPNAFSIRVNATHYETARHDEMCNRTTGADTDKGLQSFLESIPASEIQRLREGAARASDAYAYYKRRESLPDNPMKERILPDGGAAHALVRALAERAGGALYPACALEKKKLRFRDPVQRETRGYRGPKVFLC